MVDFGSNRPERPLYDLLNKVFRPGDIYTHVYGGNRGEQDAKTLGPSQALIDGRKRGVLFDVGHGSGSFRWRVAVPMIKAGFFPDTISTDLHVAQHERRPEGHAQPDEQVPRDGHAARQVIGANTWNAARAIKQEQLGHLSVGAIADVAVLRVEKGSFGFTDMHGARLERHRAAALRADAARRQGRLRPQRHDRRGLGHAAGRTTASRATRGGTATRHRRGPPAGAVAGGVFDAGQGKREREKGKYKGQGTRDKGQS